MMRTFIPIRLLSLLMLFLGLTACSGTGDVASGGGIGGTGVISTGEVTAIGSVWVNDVEFDTTAVELYIDDDFRGSGNQAIIDNINPGQIVRVEGRLNDDGSGTAERVFYASTLMGPVDQVVVHDETAVTLKILGQTVLVDENTSSKGTNPADVLKNNLVEVSGFINEKKQIQCSFIFKKADVAQQGSAARISGMVEALDKNVHTFFINDIEIDYDQAEKNGFLSEELENGIYVFVKGKLNTGLDLFRAETVAPFDRLGENNAEKIIIEGIVNRKMTANRFSIEGYTVETTSGTKYNGGNGNDILTGSHLEVEGEFLDGILVCEKVKFGRKFKSQ